MGDAFVTFTEITSCADSLGAQMGLVECAKKESVRPEHPAYRQISIVSDGEALVQHSLAYEPALPFTAKNEPQLQCSGSVCTDCHVHGWATVAWEESVHNLNTCHFCHHPPIMVLMNSGLKTMNVKWFDETTTPQNPEEITIPWVANHYCGKCHTVAGMEEFMVGISDVQRWQLTKIDRPRLEHGIETLHDFHLNLGDLRQFDWIPEESYEFWASYHRDHHGNESHGSEDHSDEIHHTEDVSAHHEEKSEHSDHDNMFINGAECMHCHGRPVHNFKADKEVCFSCHGDDLEAIMQRSDNPRAQETMIGGEDNCLVCHGPQFMGEQPEGDWPGKRPWYTRFWTWLWGS
jgi:hypothetical protein